MFGYIKGKVAEITEGTVVLENGGVGYEIICTAAAVARLSEEKDGVVYTYLQVKEDGISLFGFDTKEEKQMFLKLISVSGIGPKMGVTVLAGMRIADLATAIATSDVKTLSKIKGLGKKTAERIILELRESVSKEELKTSAKETAVPFATDDEDAVIALMGLGFTGMQARNAVLSAKGLGAKTIEEVIAFALRSLSR